MRSKASIKGHPIHPAMIAFPVAFLVAALVCDVIGVLSGVPAWWNTGAWLALAGIITAVAAAIPGFIDYTYTVPPNSSAKQRATWHMLVNLGAVALFIIAWILRGSAAAEPGWAVLLLEVGGVLLLGMGGWMGGTLVYRNLIGVDHRYADTGKWNEARFEADAAGTLQVAREDELEIDQMKLLHIGDKRIVLGRTEDGYVAFDDRCTHRGGSLAGGVLVCGKVQCLWHGSQFSASDGRVHCGPAQEPLTTYSVQVRDGHVHVTL